MKSTIPAFLERVFPRLISAGLTLLLAYVTNPTIVGEYSYAALLYTALMALTDAPARQVLLRVITEPEGEVFMTRYRAVVPVLSGLIMLGLEMALWALGVLPGWRAVVAVSPFIFAQVFTTWGLYAVGVLQTVGDWSALARGQLYASIVSVAVGVPVLFVTKDALGPSLQTMIAELVFAYCSIRWARGAEIPRSEVQAPPRRAYHLELNESEGGEGDYSNLLLRRAQQDPASINSDMASMAAYSILAWLQGQADRVLLGAFAGVSTLGSYSTASAIARAPGDSLGASTANITRAALIEFDAPEGVRRKTESGMKRALVLAAAGFLVSVLFALVASEFLGAAWTPALRIVPILAISCFPSVLAWTASVLQVKAGNARRALWAPLLGIGFAVLIAVVASRSLFWASYCVILREISVVTVAFLFVKKWAPWRSYFACLVLVFTLSILTWVLLR